uniref:Diguanylate cyclase n=1 Tax=mine drainage metagenome TaxID=410659 RepID=E6QK35_9ZZZZ
MSVAGALLLFTSWGSLWLSGPKNFSVLWPANGLLLGLLLISSHRRWRALFLLHFFAGVLVHLYFHFSLYQSVVLSAGNIVEVLVALLPFRSMPPRRTNLTRLRSLVQFTLACFLAPAISGMFVVGLSGHFLPNLTLVTLYRAWYMGDALGLFLITPLVLMIGSDESIEVFGWKRLPQTLLLLALIPIPNLLLTSPQRIPLLFLDYPLLVFVAFRLGMGGAAISVILMAIPVAHYAFNSIGVFGMPAFADAHTRILLLQAYLFIQLIMVYLISSVLASQKRLQKDLEKSEHRYRGLVDNSWDIIIQSNADRKRQYVSPAVREIMGWTQEEILTSSFSDHIHGADLARMEEMMRKLREGDDKLTLQFRMLHKNGGYRWMEIKARAVRDIKTGELKEIVSVMRDVSDRVAREKEMKDAVARAEALAMTDELTGLGNRRGFDEMLDAAWRQSAAQQTPLSVLMIDADNFKLFNDEHGHLAGDACLRMLAGLISNCIRKPADYAARYGGEEFSVILPNTDAPVAQTIAERIRFTIASSSVRSASLDGASITVSIGITTRIANASQSPRDFIRAADAALYDAKRAGRNCIRQRA